MKQSKYKIYLKLVSLVLGLFVFYLAIGLVARETLLDKSKPFPTWSYTSKNQLLNVWTSWDSGFYYDLAKNGYPKIKNDVKVAYFNVSQNKWLKVYTGGGMLGDSRFALPSSSAFEKVSNTIFIIGRPFNDERVPIFYGYEGIPYCLFDGPIDYARDVEVAREALSNPTACGDVPCTKSYVTFYSAESRSVLYQEYFVTGSVDPVKTYGGSRPLGLVNNTYMGFGCDTVKQKDLESAKSLDYKNQFSNISFGPLYPWLAKGVSMVVGDVVLGGLLLSLVFFGLSALMFYRLALQFCSQKSAGLATLAYLLFPTGFFNLAFLPVSLFNLLFFAILYFAIIKKYSWCIVLLPLLVLTSLYGVFILIPLWFVYFVTSVVADKGNDVIASDAEGGAKQPLSPMFSYALNVLVVLMALVINVVLVYAVTQDVFVLFSAKMPWWGGAQSFIGGFVTYFMQLDASKLLEILFFILTLGGLLAFYYLKVFENIISSKLLKGLSLGCAIMFGLLCLLNGGLTGVTKYYALAFPAFLYFGNLAEKDSRLIKMFAILGLLFGAIFMTLWTISSRFVV